MFWLFKVAGLDSEHCTALDTGSDFWILELNFPGNHWIEAERKKLFVKCKHYQSVELSILPVIMLQIQWIKSEPCDWLSGGPIGEMSPRVAAGLSRLLRPVESRTINKESGWFLTCNLNTEQDNTIALFTALLYYSTAV